MSKKKKALSGKAGKKGAAKKTAKKAAPQAAKKKVAKKPAPKPVKSKKTAGKAPAKPKSDAKKTTLKSLIKKNIKATSSKSGKSAKPLKNPLPVKKTAKKALPAKKAVKPVVVKKPAPAPVKHTAKPTVKAPAKTNSKPTKVVAKPEIRMNGTGKHVTPAASIKPTTAPAPATKEKAADKKIPGISSKKPVEKRNQGVLAISNTIPTKNKNEISPSKIASISYSITNPVRRTDSYAIKPEKEPNGKFELEFVVHASAEMLYEFLSSPSGLSEWFCDDLNIRNGIYTFIWDDQLQQARLLKTVDLQLVRFQWVDKTDGSYFEFRIQRDDLTNDISLIITDFAETVSERESSKLLWHSQVEKLMHVLGSIF